MATISDIFPYFYFRIIKLKISNLSTVRLEAFVTKVLEFEDLSLSSSNFYYYVF